MVESQEESPVVSFTKQWSKVPGSDWASAVDRLRPQVEAGVLELANYDHARTAFKVVGERAAASMGYWNARPEEYGFSRNARPEDNLLSRKIREEDGCITVRCFAAKVSLIPLGESACYFDAIVTGCRLRFTRDTFNDGGAERIKAHCSRVWKEVEPEPTSDRIANFESNVNEVIARVSSHFQESFS